ncbi:hypothetical protein [Nocardia testacea]|uniref:Uncharacterized protein n=1 Tax=Nocardia testacea TaxID=248551 RepID=A0ABW7VRB8_9NOCA
MDAPPAGLQGELQYRGWDLRWQLRGGVGLDAASVGEPVLGGMALANTVRPSTKPAVKQFRG